MLGLPTSARLDITHGPRQLCRFRDRSRLYEPLQLQVKCRASTHNGQRRGLLADRVEERGQKQMCALGTKMRELLDLYVDKLNKCRIQFSPTTRG